MTFRMSNRAYDALCWVARVVLPALATLYFAVAEIWHLPYAAEVVGTITAVDTFLGVVLGISTANYKAENAAISERKNAND